MNTIVRVAAGGNSTCAELASGTVQCWGTWLGNLSGVANDQPTFAPRTVGELGGVTGIALSTHGCGLRGGNVLCWGNGPGTLDAGAGPVVILGPTGPSAVRAGSGFSCAREGSGLLSCWGVNDQGQMGRGTLATPLSPGAPTALPMVSSFALGTAHACAIGTGGANVACWGGNVFGQAGQTVGVMVVTVPTVVNLVVSDVTAGGAHSCAWVANATKVQCWGSSSSGQTGVSVMQDAMSPATRHLPSPVLFNEAIVSVAAGESHTCALTASGSVYCWGANVAGQLGSGSTGAGDHIPQRVIVAGDAGMPPLTGMAGLAVGGSHACAWNAREIWCWGNNNRGQLGLPASTPLSSVARLSVRY